jgi:hypothetical protein
MRAVAENLGLRELARQTRLRPFAMLWTRAQVANIGHTGQKADLESTPVLTPTI